MSPSDRELAIRRFMQDAEHHRLMMRAHDQVEASMQLLARHPTHLVQRASTAMPPPQADTGVNKRPDWNP